MTSPSKLAHIAIRTSDLPTARDWYLNVLDAQVGYENDMLCFMKYDDEHHRVVLINDGVSSDGPPSMHHVSFTYANVDELFDTYERLHAGGIEPTMCINHGPTLSMYYSDPMDNFVELQIDTMTMEEADTFMHSETFAANPIGIPFDPADLIQKRRDGVPFEKIVQYGES